MNWVLLYFLAGLIVAVWTAINQLRLEKTKADEDHPRRSELISAYVMIALAWPLSLAVFAYAIVSQLTSGETNG